MILSMFLAAAFALSTGDVITSEKNVPSAFDPLEHFHAVNVYGGSDLQYRDSAKLYSLGTLPSAITTFGDRVLVAEVSNQTTSIVSYDANGNSRIVTTLSAPVVALRPWGRFIFIGFGSQIGQIDPDTGWLITTRTVDPNESVTDLDIDQTGCNAYVTTTTNVYLVGFCSSTKTRIYHKDNEYPTSVRILRDGDLLVGEPARLIRMSKTGSVHATMSTALDVDLGLCKIALTPTATAAVAACGWQLWQVDLTLNTATLRGIMHDSAAPTGISIEGEWRLFETPPRSHSLRAR